jgi:hypothetical protein
MPVMVATGKAKDLKNTVFQVFGYQHFCPRCGKGW